MEMGIPRHARFIQRNHVDWQDDGGSKKLRQKKEGFHLKTLIIARKTGDPG